MIRFATAADAASLLSIYAPYVEKTAVTFEYETPSVSEFSSRMEEITSFYPYLVWEQDGRIGGYAYAHRHMARAAYQWGAELSVYLSPDMTGHGLGPTLYTALIKLLTLQHIRNFYACITVPNAPSQRMHTALGFALAGVWPNAGYKLGQWHDVAWYIKTAGDVSNAPLPLLSVHDLSPAEIDRCLHPQA